MAKLTLNDIASLANTLSARQALNENFARIEAALEDTLSRSGATPNQMEADIDLNGNDLLNVDSIDASEYLLDGVPLSQSVAYSAKSYETFSGTGSQTDFTLAQHPGSLGNLEISIDGVVQRPGLDFNFTGTLLTFAVAPPGGTDNILVRYDEALPVGVDSADNILYTPPSTGDSGPLKAFLDSLWDAAEAAGGALIRFLQKGTGSQARTMQEKAQEILSVHDFMTSAERADTRLAVPLLDHTAAFEAWAAASIFEGASSDMFINRGHYNVGGEINIQQAAIVRGAGKRGTTIFTTDATSHLFSTVGGFGEITFRDFMVKTTVTRTAGSVFHVDTTAPLDGAQHALRVENVKVEDQYFVVEVLNSAYWVVTGCEFVNCLVGVWSDCTSNFDAGDNVISDTVLIGQFGLGYGCYLQNNCKMSNVKVLSANTGVAWVPSAAPGNRVDFQMTNCSIENYTTEGLLIQSTDAAATINNSIVGDNQFGTSEVNAVGIRLSGPVAGIKVDDNFIVLAGTGQTGISAAGNGAGAPGSITIADNTITGGPAGSTGIFSTAAGARISDNLIPSAATKYNVSDAQTIIDGASMPFAELPTTISNGSRVYVTDGTIAGPAWHGAISGGGSGAMAVRHGGSWVGI